MKRRTKIVAALMAAALLLLLYAVYEVARFDSCLDRIDYDRSLWHRCGQTVRHRCRLSYAGGGGCR